MKKLNNVLATVFVLNCLVILFSMSATLVLLGLSDFTGSLILLFWSKKIIGIMIAAIGVAVPLLFYLKISEDSNKDKK